MPNYKYRGINASGSTVEDFMSAPNLSGLEGYLSEQGISLITAEQAKPKKSIQFGQAAKRRRELIEVLTQISLMYKAGVTIVDAIKFTHSEMNPGEMRMALEDVGQSVENGTEIHKAMEYYPHLFNEMVINMIAGGEKTGRLDKSFDYLIKHNEWMDEVMTKIKKASIQPIILVAAAVAFVVVGFIFVIPVFAKLLITMHTDLPFISRMLIGVSDFVQSFGWLVALIVGGSIFTVTYLKKTSADFRYKYDLFMLKIPVVGPANEMMATSKFLHNLKALDSAGITLLESLELSANAAGNNVIKTAVMNCHERVLAGESTLAEAFKKEGLFQPSVRKLIAIGEEAGTLEEVFEYITEHLDKEVTKKIEATMALLEPIIMIFIGGFVLLLALSIFQPIVALMGAIKN